MQTTNSSSSAFTLVELIVSITISILLMTSIGVFMSSGMQNLFNQQATLKNMHSINDFGNEIRNTLTYTTNAEKIDDNTLLLKRNTEYDKGGYTLVGIKEFDKRFCDKDEMDTTKTNHLVLKNFIPFEVGGTYAFENTIGDYKSKQKEHIITDNNGNPIIGTGYFGKDFVEGSEGINVPLNSPTGLALDDENNLYIADTLNNRILFRPSVDITKNIGGTNTVVFKKERIYTLLEEKDGLSEPTGLFYNSTDKILLIANSGKGEILSFSSKVQTSIPQDFTIKLTDTTAINVARIDFELWNENAILPIDFSSHSKNDFTFTPDLKNINGDFVHGTNTGTLSYYFSDYGQTEKTENCTQIKNEEITKLINGVPKKITTQCSDDGNGGFTGQITTFISQNFPNLINGTDYTITLKNISLPLNASGNIFVKIQLFDTNGERIKDTNDNYLPEKSIYLTTISDGKIYTKDDNIFKVEPGKENLNYPNSFDSSGSVNELDTSKLATITNYDQVLETPIKSLDINLTPASNPDLLFLKLKYYRTFNCYNTEENSGKIKTFLFNANLK